MADYDVIVIGSGAGGGTAAWALSRAGKRVLLLERGPKFADDEARQHEGEMLIRMRPYEDRDMRINGRPGRPYVGGVAGGGSSLYGAVMLRPSPRDFTPGRDYDRTYLPAELAEWPVSYDDLAPYYDQAEDLYHVAGETRDPMPHVGRRTRPYGQRPDDLVPISLAMAHGVRARGHQPFRLPLAIDYRICLRCPSCPGYLCPTGARASSLNRCIEPAVRDHGLEVSYHCDVLALLPPAAASRPGMDNRTSMSDSDQPGSNGGSRRPDRLTRVRVRDRQTGRTWDIEADTLVLAAGAIGTPVLLQRSGWTDRSGQLGRNYMYHDGGIAAGVFLRPTGAADRFAKQIGFTDLYFGNDRFPHKLGYAQALPVPGPRSLAATLPLPIPEPIARAMHARIVTLAGAVEDLPQAGNRVTLMRDGTISLQHRFHPYDTKRAQWFKRELMAIMRRAGAAFVAGATGDADQTHTAHQVGTARFGTDPATSVLDPDCRLWGTDNVFVADGSFMPTSLGVGPALTIIANALRVSDRILGRPAPRAADTTARTADRAIPGNRVTTTEAG